MLVGIAGFARAGKDSVGQVLATHHRFRTIAFADDMRAAALALNPIVGYDNQRPCDGRIVRYADLIEQVGYERAKDCPEFREFLQRLGTGMGRTLFGDLFWVERTFGRMDIGENWAITDVRFINEAQSITNCDGIVLRVNRPGYGPANDHASENELTTWPFDHVINNDGTLDDLAAKVGELFTWAA